MEKTETAEIIDKYKRLPEGQRFELNGTFYRRQSKYKGECNCLAVETNLVMHLRPDRRFLFENGEIVCSEITRLSNVKTQENAFADVVNILDKADYHRFAYEDFIQGLNGGTDTGHTFELVAVAVES